MLRWVDCLLTCFNKESSPTSVASLVNFIECLVEFAPANKGITPPSLFTVNHVSGYVENFRMMVRQTALEQSAHLKHTSYYSDEDADHLKMSNLQVGKFLYSLWSLPHVDTSPHLPRTLFEVYRKPTYPSSKLVRELDAEFIISGWFIFQSTLHLSQHLLVEKEKGVIFIYLVGELENLYTKDLRAMRRFVFHEFSSDSRFLHYDDLVDEVFRGLHLLFGRSERGRKVYDGLIKEHRTEKGVVTFRNVPWLQWPRSEEAKWDAIPYFYLGDRVANIHEEMQSWRPRKLRDVFIPGYSDRFTYYTQMFALVIAVLGLIGIALMVVQTGFTIGGSYVTTEVAMQTLEVLQSLNASLGQLSLKIEQLNLTRP